MILLKIKQKLASKHLALEYFDFFYGAAFGAEWNKIRLAMLTGTKHAALVNNYSYHLPTEIARSLEQQGSVDLFDFALKNKLKAAETTSEEVEHLKEMNVPPMLKVYCFENGDTNRFNTPNELRDHSNLLGIIKRFITPF